MTAQTPVKVQLIQGSNSPEGSRKRKYRFLWLLILVIPACLWLTAQVALVGLGARQVEDTVLSSMAADYHQWQPQQFNPLRPELIGTIRSDQLTLVALPGVDALRTIVPFIPFGTGTPLTSTPSATPTATLTKTPTATTTSTSTPFFPSWPTRTPTLTATTVPSPTTGITVIPTAVPPPTSPPLPTVQFELGAYTVDESLGVVTIRVTLSAPSLQPVTVTYAASDGTATLPEDYDYTSAIHEVTIPAGQPDQTFDLAIVRDTLDEPDETLQVTLANPINSTLGTPNPAVVTIMDDDPPCGGATGETTLSDPALQAPGDGPLNVLQIACGQSIIIDLGSPLIIANGDLAFDLVLFEVEQPGTGEVYMDWVIVEIGTSNTGPWLMVFNWGDGGPDGNTSLGQSNLASVETDNYRVTMSPPQLLTSSVPPFLTTGVGINIDISSVSPGTDYRWVRISTPLYGDNDPSQVDYIEIR